MYWTDGLEQLLIAPPTLLFFTPWLQANGPARPGDCRQQRHPVPEVSTVGFSSSYSKVSEIREGGGSRANRIMGTSPTNRPKPQ